MDEYVMFAFFSKLHVEVWIINEEFVLEKYSFFQTKEMFQQEKQPDPFDPKLELTYEQLRNELKNYLYENTLSIEKFNEEKPDSFSLDKIQEEKTRRFFQNMCI